MEIKNSDYSSCDIYYDEDTKSLKNHKEEVIAVFTGENWVPSVPTQTYSVTLQKALQEYFKDRNDSDPEEVLHGIQRLFAKVKKEKIQGDEWMNGGCITLDLDKEDVEEIVTLMKTFLDELKVPYEVLEKPHISTAYLLGYNKFSELDDMIKILSNYQYEFNIEKLGLFSGTTTVKDYLVFSLRPPYNFYKALRYIEKNSDTIKFPEGFKSHVSLFSMEKNALTPEKQKQLNELVSANESSLFKKVLIKPKAITLYNNSKLLEIRKKLKKIY